MAALPGKGRGGTLTMSLAYSAKTPSNYRLPLMLMAGFSAIILGLIIATELRVLLIPLVGVIVAIFLLMVPMEWVVLFQVSLSLVVAGFATYLANGSAEPQWVAYLMGWMLYARLILHQVSAGNTDRVRIANFLIPLSVFFLIVMATTAIARTPIFQAFVASKEYLSLWSLLLIFSTLSVTHDTVQKVWKLVLIIAVLQLPVTLYQYFFVYSTKGDSGTGSWLWAWDAVSGTFGGSKAGGPQGYVAAFLIVHALLAFELARHKLLADWWFWAITASCLVFIVLAEVKVVVGLLPIMFGLMYWRELIRHPLALLCSLLGLAFFVAALPKFYELIHYSNLGQLGFTSTQTDTVKMLEEWFDPYWKNQVTGELGRITQFTYWWRYNGWHDWYHTLLGYGMGSTQGGRFAKGVLVLQYAYTLDGTVTSTLLWETGLLGTLSYVAMLLVASRLSAKLARVDGIPLFDRIVLRMNSAGLVVFILLISYNAAPIRVPSVQVWMILMLGHAAYWYAKTDPRCFPQRKAAE